MQYKLIHLKYGIVFLSVFTLAAMLREAKIYFAVALVLVIALLSYQIGIEKGQLEKKSSMVL